MKSKEIGLAHRRIKIIWPNMKCNSLCPKNLWSKKRQKSKIKLYFSLLHLLLLLLFLLCFFVTFFSITTHHSKETKTKKIVVRKRHRKWRNPWPLFSYIIRLAIRRMYGCVIAIYNKTSNQLMVHLNLVGNEGWMLIRAACQMLMIAIRNRPFILTWLIVTCILGLLSIFLKVFVWIKDICHN